MTQNLQETHPGLEENLPTLANIVGQVAAAILDDRPNTGREVSPGFQGTLEDHTDLLRWIRAIDPKATYKVCHHELPEPDEDDVWFDFTFSDGSTAGVNVWHNRGTAILQPEE